MSPWKSGVSGDSQQCTAMITGQQRTAMITGQQRIARGTRQRRRGATLSEAMVAVLVAAAVLVPLLAGGVAYWIGAKKLEARERALQCISGRMEVLRASAWAKDVVPGRYTEKSPPSWAPNLVSSEGKGQFVLEVKVRPQKYSSVFFGKNSFRVYKDLWFCVLEYQWPGGHISMATLKGGRK